jgi:hypothetical protein
MGDDGKRAPWWREALLPRLRGRTVAGASSLVIAATPLGLLSGCWDMEQRSDDNPEQAARADEYETAMDALALQKTQGWNAGEPDRPLVLRGASAVDVTGSQGWRGALTSLVERLAPSRAQLQPWYVPTLFQSLLGEASELLRDSISPLHTPEMDQDFARGLSVRELFEEAGLPADTAIVVDAPGPRALAVAAALSDRFEPVFAFGNWPHPVGVVPAHETLAATLYYLPVFEWARTVRAQEAPPVWVLDANRLNPYGDAGERFDNRYLAKLPSSKELQALGIRHVLYVTSGDGELDDLNAGFVELCNHGIDVKLVSLDDFQKGDPARIPTVETPPSEEAAEATPPWLWTLWLGGGGWWYGGDPYFHSCFWASYGWYHPIRGLVVGPPRGVRRSIVVGPPAVVRPTPRSLGWSPSPRASHFSAGWPSRAGFGQVPVHASRATGAFLGVGGRSISTGRSISSGGGHFGGLGGIGRSGSLGRVGGGGFSA